MIKPSEMLKSCQGFSCSSRPGAGCQTQHRGLLPSSSPRQAPAAAQTPAAGTEHPWWRVPGVAEQVAKGQPISLQPGRERDTTTQGSVSHFCEEPVILPKAAGGQQVTV